MRTLDICISLLYRDLIKKSCKAVWSYGGLVVSSYDLVLSDYEDSYIICIMATLQRCCAVTKLEVGSHTLTYSILISGYRSGKCAGRLWRRKSYSSAAHGSQHLRLITIQLDPGLSTHPFYYTKCRLGTCECIAGRPIPFFPFL